MKKIITVIALLSLFGCATEQPETPTPVGPTRDQVLNPQKYYIPIGMDVEFKVYADEMRLIDVMKQIQDQSAYTYQIYDIDEVSNYRIKFDKTKLSTIEILKVIDSQYSDKININVYEEDRSIMIKKVN